MDTKTLVWIVVVGALGVFLAWVIFSPQPGKDVSLEPGTSADSGWNVYESPLGFEVQYPPAFEIDESHSDGVAFAIPASMADRTNLFEDSLVSIERAPGKDCSSKRFLEHPTNTEDTVIGDRHFSFGEASDAAAGNVFDEYVYALPSPAGDACFAVRLFLHWTRIESYDPATVKQFDRQELIKIARDMAGTLVIR
jgi:hypothetical protein